jgi:hypothetical protein
MVSPPITPLPVTGFPLALYTPSSIAQPTKTEISDHESLSPTLIYVFHMSVAVVCHTLSKLEVALKIDAPLLKL